MAATVVDLKQWFRDGVRDGGASHMIVVCDTFNYEDYPVYVKVGEDPKEIEKQYDGKSMQKVMEVYDLRKDMDEQMDTGKRVFNY